MTRTTSTLSPRPRPRARAARSFAPAPALVCLLILLAIFTPPAEATFTFDDIDYWVGEGDNQAALVIDWNDGLAPEALAWGFQWDGLATGLDMITAIITADANLFAKIGDSGGFGTAVFGLGYDLDGDGFGLDDDTTFGPDGIADSGPSDFASPLDPDDHYQEGWFEAGYWGYHAGEGDPFAGGSWGLAPGGPADRVLSDGDWDGWSFAPGFDGTVPSEPVAAPVPAPGVAAALIALLSGAAPRRRRR